MSVTTDESYAASLLQVEGRMPEDEWLCPRVTRKYDLLFSASLSAFHEEKYLSASAQASPAEKTTILQILIVRTWTNDFVFKPRPPPLWTEQVLPSDL